MVQGESAALVNASGTETLQRWLRRFRMTHLVGHRRSWLALGTERERSRDPALDRIVYHAAGEPATRVWSIVRLDEPLPEARVAARARTLVGRRALLERLSRFDDRDTAWFLAEDRIPERRERSHRPAGLVGRFDRRGRARRPLRPGDRSDVRSRLAGPG